ncbi:glycosyltransferase [Sphingomonas parva]|uniref:Glycosyltransferase n=1 Tax=Sphingomonas parva TaxID=2555898 RepID=A0A4Y8ZV35_9SPHN|nr:glycosyltransferase [Sphingomonas parva]TFI58609.1 glycosyltransferase [Sphingomonas parva]
MRIAYPLLWARPSRAACQEQTINTVAALARGGADITLIAPQGRGDPDLSADDLRRWFDVRGDFALVQRPSRWAGERLLLSLLWLRQVFEDPEVRNADCLYSRIPAMLAMGARSPRPFATDHYRAWPDELPALRPLFRRTARHPSCLGLILHSHYAAESYRRSDVPDTKLLVAHNGVDPERMRAVPARDAARAALGLPMKRPIAVYAGRVNARKGLDQLLALADLRPSWLFLLVGAEDRQALARARPNVRLVPWQAPAALPPYLGAGDVLLVPAASAPLRRHRTTVLPIKIFAYLAAARPILAPRAPDTAELLADGDTALLVEPDRPEEAAAGLDRLLADPALAARLAAGAAARATGLSWDARAARIAEFLEARLATPQASQ